MSAPFIVSIPHRLGKDEAVRRLKTGLGNASLNYAHFFAVEEETWTGEHLQFRVRALGQAASGQIDVADDHVRLEVMLPWLLQRFAEILGTLHYLRGICGNNEGSKWRNEMQALLDAETPSGDRRARMIAGFNRGYNGFQQTYRTCTPAATLAIRRYIDEGLKICRDLTARYAN